MVVQLPCEKKLTLDHFASIQVAQRQQQQKLVQQQQMVNGPTKVTQPILKSALGSTPKVNGFGPDVGTLTLIGVLYLYS